MKILGLVILVVLAGCTTSGGLNEARVDRLYTQVSPLVSDQAIARWIAEEAAVARVTTIKLGNTGGAYGISNSDGEVIVANTSGGRSVTNLTHEIAHIGADLGGHDCRWIRYLRDMAHRFEAEFPGRPWGSVTPTRSVELKYDRYQLHRC